MGLPQPTVRIAFDLSLAGIGDFFTIGQTDLGDGVDSAPLLGPTPQDVTEFVRSISIRRGRSKFSDTFDAGQATIVLDNRARTFDPSNLGFTFNQPDVIFDDPDVTFDDLGFGSPFAPSMTPRKAVTMEVGGQLLMTGIVEDYDLAYSPDGDSTCTVKVADGFTLIAQAQLTAGTPVAEDTGARIGAVLDDNNVAWPPLRRELDTGLSTVGTAVIGENQNALQYLNLVNASEPGAVFIDRRGFVRFRNRSSLQSATGLVLSDDGTGLPFSAITREIGTEQLYTQINVAYIGGTAVVDATAAQDEFGITALNWNTLLDSEAAAEGLAEYWARRYSAPTTRLDGVDIIMDGLSATQRGQVLALELGDLVSVRFTPNGIGNPLEQAATVEQITHDITPGGHRVRLGLISGLSGFIIGESILGEEAVGF
jgi:hypothetical protein